MGGWRSWWPFRRNSGPVHLRAGVWGEDVARGHLEGKGYKTLGVRVRVGRHDELDLVMRSPDEVLVFVEVKTRASEVMGRPRAAVGRVKSGRVMRAGVGYMKKLREKPKFFRFDVVEVIGTEGSGVEPEVRHIENAFQLPANMRVYQP
ncbi:MAG TPA: YraN family protein [Kiritimatiellia bacterium]|nr:YraN family protein [Kiritimatiellia bacterium]